MALWISDFFLIWFDLMDGVLGKEEGGIIGGVLGVLDGCVHGWKGWRIHELGNYVMA